MPSDWENIWNWLMAKGALKQAGQQGGSPQPPVGQQGPPLNDPGYLAREIAKNPNNMSPPGQAPGAVAGTPDPAAALGGLLGAPGQSAGPLDALKVLATPTKKKRAVKK